MSLFDHWKIIAYARTDMMCKSHNIIISYALVFISSVSPSIHSRLRHFEVVTPQCIRTRIKRSLDTGKVLKKTLMFHAFGKQFHLELTPGWSVVDDRDLDCKMMDSTGK